MRVLITGADGFLGGHLVDHVLSKTNWDITTVTRRRNLILEMIPRVTAVHVDLAARQPELAEFPDYIIANASKVSVPESIACPARFTEDNVSIMLNTLELAREVKPRAVLLISSNEVYGPGMHREWAPIIPNNPYAASKAAQEALAIAYWQAYGVPVIIVNTMNLFGQHQGPERFIPKVAAAVSRDEEIGIHPGARNWIHARNLADGIVFLLRELPQPEGDGRPPRFNIAGEDLIHTLALADMIAEFAGKQLRYRWENSDRPGHGSFYGLDISKIAALGWKAPVSFRDSLQRTVQGTRG